MLTASVAPGVATGTVTFFEGTTALCSNVPLSGGVATCTASFTTAGTHAVTAVYNGSTSYAGSTSSALSISVNDFPRQDRRGDREVPGRAQQPDPVERARRKPPDRPTDRGRRRQRGRPTGSGFASSSSRRCIRAASRGWALGPNAGDISQMRLSRRDTPLADAIIGGMGGLAANDGYPFPSTGGIGGGIFGDGGFSASIGLGGYARRWPASQDRPVPATTLAPAAVPCR